MTTTDVRGPAAGAARLTAAVIGGLERIPVALPELLLRLGVATVFWRSGQQKLSSWQTTVMLFREEYRVPILPAELAAYMALSIELVAPVLLVLGLAARLGAAAMLAMTIVIQLWVGPLLYLLLRGPGAWSIDHVIRGRLGIERSR
jgi:putative oxidoreductase